MENTDSDEVRGWKRAAKFALEFRQAQPLRPAHVPPNTERAREQMAAWLARQYLNRTELSESYWIRTRKSWVRVADAVMKADLG